MKTKTTLLIALFLILTTSLTTAQQNVIKNPPDYIKSIVLKATAANNYSSYIPLGSSFIFEFDDLEGDQKQYSYTIEHYDYNWEKSDLTTSQYIDGFSSDMIRNFENSFNTIQNYTHYALKLPNDNLRIIKSGNYTISILDDMDEVVFSRPFIVYEELVNVGASVHRVRDIGGINEKQNVQFSINHPDLQINNPAIELKTAIYQNNDWNTVIKNVKPQFLRGSQILYKYGANINFYGLNEFLFFDTKRIRNSTNNIARVELAENFNTYLYTNEIRANMPYTNFPDINGGFVLRTIDNESVATEGEYSWVHFTLDASEEYADGDDVYIYGDYNDYQLTDENKMKYDQKAGVFYKSIFLKQGFYNYNYVTVDKDKKLNQKKIQGSFYQTENQYTIIIYYKPIGSRYDRVIGFGNTNSDILSN